MDLRDKLKNTELENCYSFFIQAKKAKHLKRKQDRINCIRQVMDTLESDYGFTVVRDTVYIKDQGVATNDISEFYNCEYFRVYTEHKIINARDTKLSFNKNIKTVHIYNFLKNYLNKKFEVVSNLQTQDAPQAVNIFNFVPTDSNYIISFDPHKLHTVNLLLDFISALIRTGEGYKFILNIDVNNRVQIARLLRFTFSRESKFFFMSVDVKNKLLMFWNSLSDYQKGLPNLSLEDVMNKFNKSKSGFTIEGSKTLVYTGGARFGHPILTRSGKSGCVSVNSCNTTQPIPNWKELLNSQNKITGDKNNMFMFDDYKVKGVEIAEIDGEVLGLVAQNLDQVIVGVEVRTHEKSEGLVFKIQARKPLVITLEALPEFLGKKILNKKVSKVKHLLSVLENLELLKTVSLEKDIESVESVAFPEE